MKQDFFNTLQLLKNWVAFVEKTFTGLTIFETFLVLIIGVASNNIYHEKHSTIYIVILIFTVLLYIIIKWVKLLYAKKYPSSIVDELEAKYQLEKANEKFARMVKINETINNVAEEIINFNPNELLELNKLEEDSKYLRHEYIIKETSKTFSSMAENIDFIFSANVGRFTMGVVFRNLQQDKKSIGFLTNSYFFRDDFHLTNEIRENIFLNKNLKGWLFDFQSFLTSSLNNNQYEVNKFRNSHKEKTIICNPMKLRRGLIKQDIVVFFITDFSNNKLPYDLESIIKTNSNLVAMWTELFILTAISVSMENLDDSIYSEIFKKIIGRS